jgi:hypothetical protein
MTRNLVTLNENSDSFAQPRPLQHQPLREEVEKKEHECRVIDTLKCSIDITTANPAIWYKGEKLERQDAIIPVSVRRLPTTVLP